MSDAERFRLLCVETPDRIEAMLPPMPGLPFLPALLRDLLARLNDRAEARCRRYPIDIVERGFFTVPSPATGEAIASGESLILPDRVTFYRFPDCPDLLVGASNLGRGYPLNGVLLLRPRLLIQLGDPLWGLRAEHAGAVVRLLDDPAWWPPRPAEEIRVFTGDQSFAHHAWNQLPALETVLIHAVGRDLPVFATFEPLGPLRALFADLGRPMPAWEHASLPAHHNAPGRVAINPGGFLLTRSIRDRLQRLAAELCTPETTALTEALTADHRPVLWVSLRAHNRTMRNQQEVLSLLCRRVFEAFPTAAILLDGYSLPQDLDANICYDQAAARALVAAERAEASRIVATLAAGGFPRPGQRLVEAVGLPIVDSLRLAQAASFSVCHHGTVQHKIGWLTATPGVVHSNTRTLGQSPEEWVFQQAEDSIRPIYLPAAFIVDEEPDATEDAEARSRLFESYRIADLEGFVTFVLDRLRAALSPDPPAAAAPAPARRPAGGFLEALRRLWPR